MKYRMRQGWLWGLSVGRSSGHASLGHTRSCGGDGFGAFGRGLVSAAWLAAMLVAVPLTGVAQEVAPDGGQAAGAATADGAAIPATLVADVEALVETMRIVDIVEILREEGIAYGSQLEADMFPGAGGRVGKPRLR